MTHVRMSTTILQETDPALAWDDQEDSDATSIDAQSNLELDSFWDAQSDVELNTFWDALSNPDSEMEDEAFWEAVTNVNGNIDDQDTDKVVTTQPATSNTRIETRISGTNELHERQIAVLNDVDESLSKLSDKQEHKKNSKFVTKMGKRGKCLSAPVMCVLILFGQVVLGQES